MQSRIDTHAKTARYFFDSIQEAQQWMAQTPRTWSEKASESKSQGIDWDLGSTFDDAMAMARDGWKEGAAKVGKALKQLPQATPAPTKKNSVYGYRPNAGRYAAGMPDCMVKRAHDNGAGHVVTLVVPINANAYTSARNMSNFGIAVMHHVRALEAQRTRVEIIVSATSHLQCGTRVCTAIRVKSASQGMDLSVLAFAMGHPAMFRRIMFGLRERTATKTDHGYGQSQNTVPSDIVNMRPGTIILNGMKDADSVASTMEAALKYVEAKVTAGLKGEAA